MNYKRPYNGFFIKIAFSFLFICSCNGTEANIVVIDNPYKGVFFGTAIRVISTSHEHVTNQKALEDYINRGIEVLCISNYSPSVPIFPISNFSYDYEDWQIATDCNGAIDYEKDENGNTKTIRINSIEYRVPVLQKVKKTYAGGFSDFEKKDGTLADLSDMPQLPNGEHTHYYWPDNSGLTATKHLNFVGSNWAEVCNGCDEVYGLQQYNDENGYELSSTAFRSLFPLWSITEMLDSVRNNVLFPGKVFGTINHPGYSSISDRYIDAYMTYGSDVFKGMEIYNNSDTDDVRDANIDIYDHTLLRGYKLWCTSANDWGNYKPNQSVYPKNRGCNILYVDKTYEVQTPKRKAEMVLDAYISGQFSAAGYGDLYLTDVVVEGSQIKISFNTSPDTIVIVIDGIRTVVGEQSTLSVDARNSRRFVRFEAYKDDDFVFTNPFFVNVDNY